MAKQFTPDAQSLKNMNGRHTIKNDARIIGRISRKHRGKQREITSTNFVRTINCHMNNSKLIESDTRAKTYIVNWINKKLTEEN